MVSLVISSSESESHWIEFKKSCICLTLVRGWRRLVEDIINMFHWSIFASIAANNLENVMQSILWTELECSRWIIWHINVEVHIYRSSCTHSCKSEGTASISHGFLANQYCAELSEEPVGGNIILNLYRGYIIVIIMLTMWSRLCHIILSQALKMRKFAGIMCTTCILMLGKSGDPHCFEPCWIFLS